MRYPSIAILDLIGLVYDGDTLSKRGLGGSESAVILISKELAKLGFPITVFNACQDDDSRPGIYDDVTAKFAKNFANRYVPEADPDTLSNFAESHVVCWSDATEYALNTILGIDNNPTDEL